jgi:hypothetical protein
MVVFRRKQDWAFVDMDEDGILPIHLLCIINIPKKPVRPINLNGTIVDEKCCYFLTHAGISCLTEEGVPPYKGTNQNEGTLAHIDQRLVHRVPKSHLKTESEWVLNVSIENPSLLLLLGTKSIVGLCIALPDILGPDADNEYFTLCWLHFMIGVTFLKTQQGNGGRKKDLVKVSQNSSSLVEFLASSMTPSSRDTLRRRNHLCGACLDFLGGGLLVGVGVLVEALPVVLHWNLV